LTTIHEMTMSATSGAPSSNAIVAGETVAEPPRRLFEGSNHASGFAKAPCSKHWRMDEDNDRREEHERVRRTAIWPRKFTTHTYEMPPDVNTRGGMDSAAALEA
jgi:hypothetical protein